MTQVVKSFLEECIQTQKGVTFFIRGNTMVGVVTKIVDDVAVEIRNRESSKAMILIERIDGMQLS